MEPPTYFSDTSNTVCISIKHPPLLKLSSASHWKDEKRRRAKAILPFISINIGLVRFLTCAYSWCAYSYLYKKRAHSSSFWSWDQELQDDDSIQLAFLLRSFGDKEVQPLEAGCKKRRANNHSVKYLPIYPTAVASYRFTMSCWNAACWLSMAPNGQNGTGTNSTVSVCKVCGQKLTIIRHEPRLLLLPYLQWLFRSLKAFTVRVWIL